MAHRSVPPYQRQNARKLRRDLTDIERKLWYALRGRRFGNVGFQRQVPIGSYIVDFASNAAKLVIELDGGQHCDPDQVTRDETRDRFIIGEGYRVLRFWNFEINSEFDAVLDRIYLVLIEQGIAVEPSELLATPLPVPLPQGERGRPN